MSNFLIAAGFVIVAFIGSKVVQLLLGKKEESRLDDLLKPRPSTASPTAPTKPRFHCPFEFNQIDLTKREHVEWLKSERDPELWHVAAQASLAYTGDPHNFVPWVVEQKELDRSTGGWIFLWLEGSQFLKGEDKYFHSFSSDNYIKEVFSKLTSRSEATGFSNNIIGLDVEFEKERQNCLRLIAEGRAATDIVIPRNLLDAPYPRPRPIRGIDNVEGVLCF